MCKVFEVSRSGYYDRQDRVESARVREDRELAESIQKVYAESGKRYGPLRVWHSLRRMGYRHSRKRITRLMAKSGLFARKRKRFVRTTQSDPNHQPASNLLARDFHADAPNRKWVTDIKHIPTAEGDLYLAATLDLFSRRVVGWAMEETLEVMLTCKALDMAIQQRNPAPNALVHSDRGSQYTAGDYRATLRQHALTQSMSRKGNCWDNAPMESFFSTLEFECLRQQKFATRAQAKLEVFTYIEMFYNRKRLHSSLGYLSPAEFESQCVTIPTVR
jgi:transposase InsO family protein